MNAKQEHQHLRVATEKNNEKAPGLLDCNPFANSVVSSDSANLFLNLSKCLYGALS